ncbi:MAG: flagellar protein FlgN [Hyphomicrobiaceae bacterium]
MAQGLLEKTIDRLEDLVDEETSALRAHKATDLRDFNNRKSQALLELSRVARMVGNGPLDADLRDRLGVLHAKLETNRGVIKMHLDAVREIAAVVSGSIQESQSDGTYSPAVRKGSEPK